jgi:DNA-binding LacI/PurR family transcriptional regulator
MSITLRDVAGRSQVSISTASRALNGRSDVSKEVRERVLTAARELQYTANHNARALKGITNKTLGVVLYDERATTFNAALMRGIYDAATPRGYSVIVCDGGASIEAEQQAYQLLLEKRVDGALVNSGVGGIGPLRRLVAAGIPFVVLNRRMEDAGDLAPDYVRVDQERGTYLATRHLLDLGHTRILYHALALDSEPSLERLPGYRRTLNVPSLERLPGYRRALAEYEIPFAPELIMKTDSSLADAHRCFMRTMRRLQLRPTGVIAYNDNYAVAILKALHDLELRVPEDVAVVGQNNLPFTAFLVPPLTTVEHAVQQVGRQGTEILLQKLAWSDDRPWPPNRVALEPSLIVRESTGRPGSGAPKRTQHSSARS